MAQYTTTWQNTSMGGQQGPVPPSQEREPAPDRRTKDCWKVRWIIGSYTTTPAGTGTGTSDVHFKGFYHERCKCTWPSQGPPIPANCYSIPTTANAGTFCCEEQFRVRDCGIVGSHPSNYIPISDCNCYWSIDFKHTMNFVDDELLQDGPGVQIVACEALAAMIDKFGGRGCGDFCR